jgi:hypothetical protein
MRGVSSVKDLSEGGVRVSIGSSNWVCLAAAILILPAVYEMLR